MVATESVEKFIRQTKFDSIHTAVNILIDTLLCIATFFISTFIIQTLTISLILSAIVGIVCVIRYNGFKKFYKHTNLEELAIETQTKLKGYEKLFDKNSLILSILDFVTTFIIILTIGLFVQAQTATLVGIIIRGGVLAVRAGNNAIQLGKLLRALRAMSLISGVYLIARKKNKFGGEKMRKWLNANKWSIVIGSIMASVCGFGTYLALGQYVSLASLYQILLSVCTGLIGFILTFWLGHDTVLTWAAKVNARKLGSEKFADIINISEKLIADVEESKQKSQDETKAKAELEIVQKQLEMAKATLEKAGLEKAELEAKYSSLIQSQTPTLE